jgi:hypothetical protein
MNESVMYEYQDRTVSSGFIKDFIIANVDIPGTVDPGHAYTRDKHQQKKNYRKIVFRHDDILEVK